MNKVYLLIGSNIGERSENLNNAAHSINKRIGRIICRSHIYETEPWGYQSKSSFYNQCLLSESDKEALTILYEIQSIEKEMGRVRDRHKITDRTIDIDILFFNDECINLKILKIPHPKIHERKFALIPLYEIAPDLIHPVFRQSIEQLLEECKDRLTVRKICYH